ncbi:MAG TPA: MerR family transcriptional regulator [Cyclobacteriaceae bacterium]|nr:MerR family transcriptional regulator [Cyclobacteriaceae bacterium]
MKQTKMGRYSIKELETLSGIKAHTIRIWEKRHRLIIPERTPTNIRYYSDEDLKKIINVSLLNNHGIKISKIAEMSDSQIQSEIVQLTAQTSETDLFIEQLIIAMIDMEEEQFEKILSHLVIKFGFEKMITEIAYPFLEKIGVLWQTGNIDPAQEHFISNLMRQKIIVAIDSLPFAPHDARKVVMFLPENELHELGLLYFHYILRKNGFRTFYLGQHLPLKDVISVCRTHKPEALVTVLTVSAKGKKTQQYVEELLEHAPGVKLFAAGHYSTQLDMTNPNLKLFKDASSLLSLF